MMLLLSESALLFIQVVQVRGEEEAAECEVHSREIDEAQSWPAPPRCQQGLRSRFALHAD
jgi:hypothetical protein